MKAFEIVKIKNPGKTTTFLTSENILHLQRMFNDETSYIEYMETLWVLRELAEKAMTIPSTKEILYDLSNPYYKIAKLTNELIGALLNNGISFRVDNGQVYHFKTGER
jgi:hypothetical protein